MTHFKYTFIFPEVNYPFNITQYLNALLMMMYVESPKPFWDYKIKDTIYLTIT